MADLEALAAAIRQLSPTEREQLNRLVEAEQREEKQRLNPEQKIAALRRGRDKFREGLSDAEMRQITDMMNTEYVKPEASE